MRVNPFTGFSSRRDHEKNGHYKVTDRLYFTSLWGIFKSSPPEPHVLLLGPAIELSHLVVAWNSISGKKLSLLCLSNIVCYRF